MRKKILLIGLVLVILIGCFFIATYIKNNNKEEARIRNEIVRHYKQFPEDKGPLKIYNTKKMGNEYLVLSENYFGEGEHYTDLFLLNSKFKITKRACGNMPMTPCISVNKLTYEGKTIIFGSFIDTKPNKEFSEKFRVDIKKIKIKLKNGSEVKENVSLDSGYIVVLDGISDIEEIVLYNDKDEEQMGAEDLELYYGKDINDSGTIKKEFTDYKKKDEK